MFTFAAGFIAGMVSVVAYSYFSLSEEEKKEIERISK